MNEVRAGSVTRWWVAVVAGAATVLLFAWLGRLAGVSPAVLWSIGAAFAAVTWVVVLVTVPWNLYFAARRIVAEVAVSRERGIDVRAGQEAEAGRIARRMLRFAIAGHVGTAAVTAVAAYVSGAVVGYAIAGFFLLSTAIRPAAAYFAHLRHRIAALTRDITYPRDDVVTLRHDVDELTEAVRELRAQLTQQRRDADDDLRRTTSGLAEDLARVRQQADADRTAARSRDDELRRTIDQMVRRIDATLDGISDHQELLTGIRALVRMFKSEAA